MYSENVTNNKSIEDIVSDRIASGEYDFNYIQQNENFNLLDEQKDLETDIGENKVSCRKSDTGPELILWPSDSDITLLRVKRAGLQFGQCAYHTWDEMHDAGVPGDGTHLAESPSMVNLVTLVESGTFYKRASNYESHIGWNCFAGGEYLIALSSWEPTDLFMRDIFYADSTDSYSSRCEQTAVPKRLPALSSLSAKVSKLFTACFPRLRNSDHAEDSDSSE